MKFKTKNTAGEWEDVEVDMAELCKESHDISKKAGWLDTPRSLAGDIGLMHSEVSEALEDYRKNLPLEHTYYEVTIKSDDGKIVEKNVVAEQLPALMLLDGKFGRGDSFVKAKPCGIPTELADLVIRVCQFSGSNNVNLVTAILNVEQYRPSGRIADFEELIVTLHAYLSDAWACRDLGPNRVGTLVSEDGQQYGLPICLAQAVRATRDFCDEAGIDLLRAVKEKAAYNSTRAYRHGGKRI